MAAKGTRRLVIVESATKAKKIAPYLGSDYVVEASVGHIRDLPRGAADVPAKYKKEAWARLGVDVDHGFTALYVVSPDKKKKVADLKAKLKDVDELFLATDPDREGEAIAWHLLEVLKPKVPVRRMVFNEITKPAILAAAENTRELDDNLVDAQETRRILDRLYGYEISPVLWKKVMPRLSAGRVQSVATRVIVERERERMAFVPATYWDLTAELDTGKDDGDNPRRFNARLTAVDKQRVAVGRDFNDKGELKNNAVVLNADTAQALAENLHKASMSVANVEEKPYTRKPYPPFMTSTLQQEAGRKLHYTSERTMRIAQRLYENGHITYMRTDSTRISPVAQNEAASYINDRFGSKYSKHGSKVKNASGAQDAHEAIRPSSVFNTPESIAKYLDKDQLKLYTLIWNRFVASQMTGAIFDTMAVKLSQNGVQFAANGSQVKFDGYLAIYNDSDKNKMLPDMAVGDVVKQVNSKPEQHFTQPPARYSEATLIKTLEENGVGRPSTYAPTIETIQKRYYVRLAAKRFEPTELGEIVNKLIVEYFPDIVNVTFTAEMEGKLDDVEVGKEQWQRVIDEFYKPFSKEVAKAESEMEKIQIKDEPAGFDCEVCGSPMVIKLGRFGKFYACSNFPDCRHTQAIVKEIGVECPSCHQGQIIERKTKRNRIFYGCNRYPECEFTSWDKPIGRDCPKCGHFLVEKKVRGGGKQVVCSNGDYEEEKIK